MSIINKPKRNLFSDSSLWFLLFSNTATIFLAITENWNLSTIMWVYWFQNIIIGFFNFIRILQLKEVATKGVKVNGQPIQTIKGKKIFIAFFFLFHFGLFHFVYLGFLLAGMFTKDYGQVPNLAEVKYILLGAVLFFINHLFSHFYNKTRDSKKQNIISLMFSPYARVVPMHLTIILGSLFVNALPFFLALKTLADIMMHVVEHRVLRRLKPKKSIR